MGFGAGGGDFEFSDEGEFDRRQAGCVVAGLVAQDERNFLGAERGIRRGSQTKADGEFPLIYGKLVGGKTEFAEDSRRVGCGEHAEAGGQRGGELGGDEEVL